MPLHDTRNGVFTEALGVVLACQSANGTIVGHLSFSIQVEHDGDNDKVVFSVFLDVIHVRRRWRRRGFGNDLVVAAAFIAEDCLVAAFRALSPTNAIQVYFFCDEADTVGGYRCRKHFSDYLEFQVMERLREGDYGLDVKRRELRYEEAFD